ncbi:family 78 glycoside hydrolase catalytic domain [Pedobacter frigoris]|uniref:family 78 glycoside hydrolase catalytic domain n=1 Tax=Pedobacter frigoris TaxID=2571272 RepID=UPI00293096AB|nr:family 78 glycoside hydrolase catalytic domain [Pedobacter frigoris]
MCLKNLLTFWLLFSFITCFSQNTKRIISDNNPLVANLRCGSNENPLGVDQQKVYLSWQLTSRLRNVSQSAWQVLVASSLADLNNNKGTAWDSGKQQAEQSIQIEYSGKPLMAAEKYYWKVKVWDNKGNESAWSKPAFWQMGLLKPADWKNAKWIAYDTLSASKKIIPGIHGGGDPKLGPGKSVQPLLRREVQLKKKVKQATMFISGLGHFELNVNGKKAGDHFLDPGWTKYDEQAQYVTFDLTGQLKQGKNVLGVSLGNGFYYTPRERYRKITVAFDYPKLIGRLLIEYSDGTFENIITDESWKTIPGPITFSSIYGGEDYNATHEKKGWDLPGYDDRQWKKAILTSGPSMISAQSQAPIKIFEQFYTKKITQPKPGVWVYDVGQNASAIPWISVNGKRGMTVRLTPAELLNEDGTVNQSAAGQPYYFDYTLKGEGLETWQPQFTYYGFRYIQVEGAVPENQENPKKMPVIAELKSLHMRNAARSTGTFSTSNQLFNKTSALIDWSVRSNMMSVFTDCPHREKLGWLEEVHLMGGSIRYNYDIASLCRKVLKDIIVSQTDDGLIPDIAPEYVQFDDGFRDSPEWGSTGVILPWYLYEWYGDKEVLEESYSMMEKYVSYLSSKAKSNILSHGLGDWFDIGPNAPGEAQLTPKQVTATSIYYYDLVILSKAAAVLNKREDSDKYLRKANEVKAAYNAAFFNRETKQYSTGSQTANAMSVYLGLVDPKDKEAVVDNLVKEIKGRNNALSAGDIGYRYVLRVLEEAGRSDVIFDMNNRSDVPGYGWQLDHGATALTESWQAYGFVSNNHFMLGHLMEWFYSGLAGIQQGKDDIAFKQIVLRPSVVGDVSRASASYQSPYGQISSAWEKIESGFNFNVQIPVNTTATVYVPNPKGKEVKERGMKITGQDDIQFIKQENGCSVYKIGPGTYSFSL